METLSLCPSVSLLVVGSLSLTLDSLCVDREVSLSVSEVDRDVSLSVSQTEFDVKGKDKRCHCLTDGFPLSLPVWTPVMDPSQDPWSCRDGRSPSLSLSLLGLLALPWWPLSLPLHSEKQTSQSGTTTGMQTAETQYTLSLSLPLSPWVVLPWPRFSLSPRPLVLAVVLSLPMDLKAPRECTEVPWCWRSFSLSLPLSPYGSGGAEGMHRGTESASAGSLPVRPSATV